MTVGASITPDADESARELTRALRAHIPFYFIKLGDAAVECINGYKSHTCDGELYTPELSEALLSTWDTLGKYSRDYGTRLFVGDWQSASFSGPNDKSRYSQEYARLMERVPTAVRLHFECLLLMRDTPELLDFYRAVRNSPKRKLLVGPSSWAPVAELLACNFLALPVMPRLLTIRKQLTYELLSQDFDILLYGAGMAGHVSVIDCWKQHPERTYINLGSALDPATSRGKTRRQQMEPNHARMFLDRLKPRVTPVFRDWCSAGHQKGQRGCALCEDL